MEENIKAFFENLVAEENKRIGFNKLFESIYKELPDISIQTIFNTLQSQCSFKYKNSFFHVPSSNIINFLKKFIEKTGSDKIYIPYARGVEVEELKKIIARIDYNGIKSKVLKNFDCKTVAPIDDGYYHFGWFNNEDYLVTENMDNSNIKKKIEEDKKKLKIDDNQISSEFINDLIKYKIGINSVTDDIIQHTEYPIIFYDLPFKHFEKNDVPYIDVEKSIRRLSDSGYAIFNFKYIDNPYQFIKIHFSKLIQKKIYLNAIIKTGENYRHDNNNYILILSRQEKSQIFLAELSRDNDSVIIDNFLKNISMYGDRYGHLGTWTNYEPIENFDKFLIKQERKIAEIELAKNCGGELLPLSEVCSEVNELVPIEEEYLKYSWKKDFIGPRKKISISADNAIYIPETDEADQYMHFNVETTLTNDFFYLAHGEYPIRCFQVLLNKERILPDYLARILNTPTGIYVRSRLFPVDNSEYGEEEIKSLKIPVPDIKSQKDYIAKDDIVIEIEKKHELLRNNPGSSSEIFQEIQDITKPWIETFPYPLATILKIYSQEDSASQKKKFLLLFFEAYSIVMATILTAIYRQSDYRNTKIDEIDATCFKSPTFGTWIKLDKAITKVFRKEITNKKKIQIILNSFHTTDLTLVKLLTDNNIYKIVNKACIMRNKRYAHDGVSNEEIDAKHVKILEGYLDDLIDNVGDLYKKIKIIRQIELKKHNREYINKIEILTGSNPNFSRDKIITKDGLEDSCLYLYICDTQDVIELPPIIILKDAEIKIKNACYFYNSLENDGARYKSFYYDIDPENIAEGADAYDALSSILSSDTPPKSTQQM